MILPEISITRNINCDVASPLTISINPFVDGFGIAAIASLFVATGSFSNELFVIALAEPHSPSISPCDKCVVASAWLTDMVIVPLWQTYTLSSFLPLRISITFICFDAVAVQPFESVTVRLYVVLTVGLTAALDAVEPLDQLYEYPGDPPEVFAVIVIDEAGVYPI